MRGQKGDTRKGRLEVMSEFFYRDVADNRGELGYVTRPRLLLSHLPTLSNAAIDLVRTT